MLEGIATRRFDFFATSGHEQRTNYKSNAALHKFAIPTRAAKHKKDSAENEHRVGRVKMQTTRRERKGKRATAKTLACQAMRGTFKGLKGCTSLPVSQVRRIRAAAPQGVRVRLM